MSPQRIYSIVIIILVSLVLTGCAEFAMYQFAENSETMNKVYDDPGSKALQDSELAILENNSRVIFDATISVERIDGKSHEGWGRVTKYRLLPGGHAVVATLIAGNRVGGAISKKFNALAGRVYELRAESDGKKWGLSIVDKASGVVVSY